MGTTFQTSNKSCIDQGFHHISETQDYVEFTCDNETLPLIRKRGEMESGGEIARGAAFPGAFLEGGIPPRPARQSAPDHRPGLAFPPFP